MRNLFPLRLLRWVGLLFGVALLTLVQGCNRTVIPDADIKPARASLNACCTDMEDYPRWYVDMARTMAPALGRVLSHVAWRSGYLKSKSEAQNAILTELEPLDIVLVSSKGRQSGQMIPGYFGHAAVYLGTERQLTGLGIWSNPKVRENAAGIRSGRVFIEADAKGVHLSPPSIVLNTDAVAILRPRFRNAAHRRKAALDFFDSLGMDFDFLFDVDSPDCTFCTELIHRVMPQLDLPILEIYGVRTIMPDSVAVAAIRRKRNLDFVGYIKADRNRWSQGSLRDLADDIAGHWATRKR